MTHNDSKAPPAAIASIGTSQTGLLYLSMPVISIVLTKYPRLRPWCGPLGLVMTVASLVASSYTSGAGPLIATQGVLYAVGCALLFGPTSLYLDDWFVARKGLAYGVMWASKASVGVVTPFLMQALLDRYGLAAALRIWAVATVLLTLPLVFLLKPRRPPPGSSSTSPGGGGGGLSFIFMRHPIFWMLELGCVIQSLGYQMPSTYLAAYAASIGASGIAGPVLLAAFSLASVPGAVVMGLLGDRLPATTVILISSAGSAASVFLLWGLALHVGVLVVFAIAYGFFAGGFSSTWPGILHEMKRRDDRSDTGLVFAMLMGGRGLGFVLSGPVGGALLDAAAAAPSRDPAGTISMYASHYGPIIICTGVTAVLGAWGWFWSLGKPCLRIGGRLRNALVLGR